MPGETIATYVARRTGAAGATDAMEAAADALGSGAPGADDAYSAALDRWLASGAADLDDRLTRCWPIWARPAGRHDAR